MAKERTDKSRYISKYKPEETYITPAQYIAELMCERVAAKNQEFLPIDFWNIPKWNKEFKKQITMVYPLLKKYDEKAIIAALRRKEAKKVYSLGAKWILDRLFKEEQAKLESVNKEVTQFDEEIKKPKQRVRKSKMGKLNG